MVDLPPFKVSDTRFFLIQDYDLDIIDFEHQDLDQLV
jgi:hypothetical protein